MDREDLVLRIQKIYDLIDEMLEEGTETEVIISSLLHASIDTLNRAEESEMIDPYTTFGKMNYLLFRTMDIHNQARAEEEKGCSCSEEECDNG